MDRRIDENLKKVFAKSEDEHMPPELSELLGKLRAQDVQCRGK